MSEFKEFDPSILKGPEIYRVMIGGIIPRPIAFVSTMSKSGLGNVAPFSFFMGVSSRPPALAISITTKTTGGIKDTLRNIKETGEFVVNTVCASMIGAVNQASGEYPPEVDERVLTGLGSMPSKKVSPPRILESPIHFECKKINSLSIGDGGLGSATLIVGEILMVHVRSDALDEKDRLRPEVLSPIARLGGLSYSRLGEIFDLPRPKV